MDFLQFYRQLKNEQQQMCENVFTHPPKTWEEFQRRRGEYDKLTSVITNFAKFIGYSGESND
jgi:hypothetical protein